MRIAPAHFPEDRAAVQALFREYQQHINIDLYFQSFDNEVAALPGHFAPPKGNIILARDGGAIAGCIAWHPLTEAICEVKRLYVKPVFRGHGTGKELLRHVIHSAKEAGYVKVWLDSLERLTEAQTLYDSFGFKRIAPYNDCPLPDFYCMELNLAETQAA